jgi:hypothetical protein
VWTRLVEADGGARSWELVPIASSKCVSRGRRGRLEAGRWGVIGRVLTNEVLRVALDLFF